MKTAPGPLLCVEDVSRALSRRWKHTSPKLWNSSFWLKRPCINPQFLKKESNHNLVNLKKEVTTCHKARSWPQFLVNGAWPIAAPMLGALEPWTRTPAPMWQGPIPHPGDFSVSEFCDKRWTEKEHTIYNGHQWHHGVSYFLLNQPIGKFLKVDLIIRRFATVTTWFNGASKHTVEVSK